MSKPDYPSYCCQLCGSPIGWLGRLFQLIGAGFHQFDCRPAKKKGGAAAAPQAEPQPEREPLSDDAKDALWQKYDKNRDISRYEWFHLGIADAEREHGIGTKGGDK